MVTRDASADAGTPAVEPAPREKGFATLEQLRYESTLARVKLIYEAYSNTASPNTKHRLQSSHPTRRVK